MKIVRVLMAVHLFVALVDIVPSYGQVSSQLIEAAKKEGEVVFYGAIPVNIVKRITDLFEKKYSITVKHWRGDATEIVNRVLTESRAGRPTFDVTLGNEAVMQALDEKGLLGVFDPPAAKGYPKQFRDPDLRMTAWRVLPYGINYNYQQIKGDEAPKTYEELLLPKWKGKFGLANPGIHVTTLQFVLSLEKIYGAKWLKIVEGWAKQEPRLGRSLTDLLTPMTSGEVPVAISYIKDKFQFPGPIDYVRMNKYLASVGFVAISKQAPHPNAAKLFTEFFLTAEPQRLFGESGEYVLNPEVDHKFKKDVKEDQIVVMKLPTNDEMESCGKKFREMFR
jgi:iron(III) transport system substrate-binding protein